MKPAAPPALWALSLLLLCAALRASGAPDPSVPVWPSGVALVNATQATDAGYVLSAPPSPSPYLLFDAGTAASPAGDVDGDAVPDIVTAGHGAIHVVLGPVTSRSSLGSLVRRGRAHHLTAPECTGHGEDDVVNVAAAGDVDGDGLADVVLVCGKTAFMLLGRPRNATWPSSTTELVAVRSVDGRAGGVGDVDGDKLGDLCFARADGSVALVLGRAVTWRSVAAVDVAKADAPVVVVRGARMFGGAGDVDGDGVGDVVMGNAGLSPGGVAGAGSAFVVFGRRDWPREVDLLDRAAVGVVTLEGQGEGDALGAAVAGVGDVNGDGSPDVAAAMAMCKDCEYGKYLVVFGAPSSRSWPRVVAARTAPVVANVTMSFIESNGHSSGALPSEIHAAVSSAGDVNGDHVADLLLCYASDGWSGWLQCTITLGSTGAWPAVVDVSSRHATIRSLPLSTRLAWNIGSSAVGALGDIDGDGLDDVLFSAQGPQLHPLYRDQRMGFVAVIRGCRQWPRVGVNSRNWTSAMDRGQQPLGYTLLGDTSAPRVGSSVHSVGDLDGDGLADFAVGAPGLSRVYLHFQRPAHSSSIDDHAAVISSNDWGDQFGWSVSSAGDVNGDGLADIVVGAPEAANGTGRVFVVFGQRGRWAPGAALDVAGLNGTNGFALTGDVDWPGLGFEVSRVGDFNGDRIDDLLVSAVRVSMRTVGSARAYVVLGRKQWPATIAVLGLNGSNGFAVDTALVNSSQWFAISNAGDVNADGFADVALGALHASGQNMFRAHVLFGTTGPWSPIVSVSKLDGIVGFTVEGSSYATDELWRFSIAAAGDVNGDKYGDLLMGASMNNFVVLGHGGDWTALLQGQELRNTSAFMYCSWMYSVQMAAGDLNGDSVSDVVCLSTNPMQLESHAKVLFGVAGGTPQDMADRWKDDTGVFTLSIGYDALAVQASVSGAGDFNGDRVDDLLIGTPEFNSSSGKVWVWYGSTEPHIGRVVMGESDSLNLTVGKPFSLVVPSDAFSAGRRKLTLGLDWDGQYVYKWFSFDPVTSTLSGTPPTNDIGFTFPVFLKAENDRGVSVAQRLYVRVLNSLSVDLGTNSETVIFGGEPSPNVFNQFGWSVSSVDMNGNGLANVVISAPETANSTGRVFVMFGQQGQWVPRTALDIAGLNGTNGFTLTGDVDLFGRFRFPGILGPRLSIVFSIK
eukprot:m51a1_g5786 hypothetical protein (1187) ;mRNA; f:16843-27087